MVVLDREQSVDEVPLAFEGDPKIFDRGSDHSRISRSETKLASAMPSMSSQARAGADAAVRRFWFLWHSCGALL